jgi:hypothetical protein
MQEARKKLHQRENLFAAVELTGASTSFKVQDIPFFEFIA